MKNRLIISIFIFALLFLTNVGITHAFVGSTNPNPVPDNEKSTNENSTEVDLFSGQVDHQIPLQVPPGTDGLTPQLSLQYQSGRAFGNGGLFGFGWSIEVPFIFRDTNHTPGNTSDDYYRLAWNGTSYKLIDQGSGKYKTNIETYLTITHQSSGASNATGDYWTVQTTDGTTYRFGYNANSEVACSSNASMTLGWALDDVIDSHSNNIYYNYVQNPNGNDIGTIYPTSIQYNNDKDRSINFTLSSSDSPVMREGYYGGCLVRYSRNLNTISTTANGSPVKTYVLNYSNTISRNILNSVTEEGSNGASLPSTTFNYNGESNSSNTGNPSFSSSGNFDAADLSSTDVRLYDVNGDGLPDIVKSKNIGGTNETYEAWLNNGNGWNTSGSPNWSSSGNFDAADLSSGDVTLADVNNDGLADIVKSKNTGGPNETYEVWLNNGSGWNTSGSPNWSSSGNFDAADLSDGYTQLIDVNGDGLPDIVRSKNTGGPNETYEVWLNTGSGWNAGSPSFSSSGNFDAADFSDTYTKLVDVNGDGLPDIVRSKNITGPFELYEVWLNTGNGWSTSVQNWVNDQSIDGTDLSDNHVQLVDVNGDGLPDIVKSKNNTGPFETYEVFLNTGSGWSTSPEYWVNNKSIDGADLSDTNVRFGDVNGDGIPDIVESKNTGGTNETYEVWTGIGNAPDLLSSIHTEKGGTINYSYGTSTGTSGTKLPFNDWLVTQMTIDNGMSNNQHTSDTTSYTYKNGVYNWPNKEFRGFGEVDELDPNGAFQQSFFKQDDGLKGTLYQHKLIQGSANGAPYADTDYTWNSSLNNGVYTNTLTAKNDYLYDGSTSPPKATETDYQYDQYGNVTKESDLGDTSVTGDERYKYKQYTYNTSSYIVDLPYDTYTEDANANKVSETWDYYDNNSNLTDTPTKGDLTKEVKWLNGGTNPTTTYTYDSFGNKTQETDANNHATSYAYDSTGTYQTSTTNAKNQTTNTTYDLGTGNLLSKTDPNGYATTYTYDPFGRVSTEIDQGDTSSYPTKSYTYYDNSSAPQGKLESQRIVSGQSGTLDTYTFTDGLGRTVQTRKPAENTGQQIVTDTFYDPNRKVSKVSVPHLDTLSTTYANPVSGIENTFTQYDPMQRVISVTNPQGTTKTTSYNHWVETDTDENGHQTTKTMDAYNNILEVDEYNNGQTYKTTYIYDPLNNLTKITDDNGNIFSFTYDTLGRKISQTDPDMGTWTYAYDGVGNMTSQTDARGKITTKTYDPLNRVLQVSYPSDPSATYTYDGTNAIGTLASVTDAAGTVSYSYDNRLRKTQEQRVTDGNTWTESYTYDDADHITKTTYPDSTAINNTYDAQGQIASASGVVNNVDYNAFDKVTDKTLANGQTTNYTYSPTDFKLDRIQTGTAQDVSYTYDNVGNVKTVTDNLLSKTQTFGYDDLDRLINASQSAGYNYTYAYDPIGNLTSVTSPDTTTTYTYGSSTLVHAPATEASTTMIYDDSLAYGWTDASFNTTNSTEATDVYSGSSALSSVIGANGGLDFQAPKFFTTGGYSYVQFALKATQSGQQYKVYADTTFGQALATPVSLANYGGQPTTSGWTVYKISLADLGATDITLGDLVIYNATSSNEPAVHVDQVELMSGVAPTSAPTPTPTPGGPTVTPTPTSGPTPTPTPAVPQMVQGTDGLATTGSSGTVPYSSNVTAGNMLLVVVSQHSGTVTGISDTQGDTFTAVTTAQHANTSTDYTELYYAKNVQGGATSVTVNFSTSTKFVEGVYEYSGLDQTSPLDQVTTNTGNSASPNGGTLTTTVNNELYFVVGVDDYTGNTGYTAGSGYTVLNEVEDGTNNERIVNESQISAQGSYSTNYTISNTAHWAVIGASFKPANAGTSTTPTPTLAGPTATPTPTSGGCSNTILSGNWNLSGNNGSDENDEAIPSNSLSGMSSLQVTINLHGATFGTADDEASVIFIQNGDWRAANVIVNGAQNGLNGNQTLTIPLSAFHKVGDPSTVLDTTQPVSNFHARFWNSGAFTVDVSNVILLGSGCSGTATPTPTPAGPTATPTPTSAPTATPTPTPATPQMIQGTDGTAITGNTATVPYSSNVTAGNMLLVAVTQHSGSVTGISDSQGDTFTAVTSPQHANSSTDYTEMYYAKNAHGGPTSVTVNFSTTTKLVEGIYEYSGLDQTSPLDQVTTNTGNSAAPNGGNLTTTIDNELYFVVGVDDYTGNTTYTAGNGYTLLNEVDDGTNNERIINESQISAQGSYATNYTISNTAHWAVIGASFRPAGSGPIPTATPTPTSGGPTPTPTPSTPQLVQAHDGITTTANTGTIPFSSNVTSGDLILVAITQHSGTVSSVSDNQGDTYTAVTSAKHANSSTDYTELYYAKNVHGGATSITVNFSTSTKMNFGLYEFSGLNQTSPLDQVAANTGNSASPNGGSITTTPDNEVYFAIGVDDNGNNATPNAGSGYTLLDDVDSTSYERYYSEYQISAHGTYSTNFSIATTSHWAVIGASFKP